MGRLSVQPVSVCSLQKIKLQHHTNVDFVENRVDSPSCHYHSKAPGTLHPSKSSPSLLGASPISLSSSTTTLDPAHSFHTFNSCAYKSITQGSQLLPQQSPAGGLTGLVGDVAAARRAVSRTGAGRAFRSFVSVGEWDFSVAVEIVGCCAIAMFL